jgi:tRNA U34 5-methylaminomethyl-2-thiouridine-forming methyltransferase MnmC
MTDNSELGDLVQTADGSWTIRHPEKAEEYHSTQGARFEAEHLYMESSGFAEALVAAERSRVSVLDVGLGLGYNALTTIEYWAKAANPPELWLSSLEMNPQLVQALVVGQAPWAQGWPEAWLSWSQALQQQESVSWSMVLDHPQQPARKLYWQAWVGDARQQLSRIKAAAPEFDFIWQDPFSPKKNPELWSEQWFADLSTHTAVGATLVTYSVARGVRDALAANSWDWERQPAPGKKRHWLRAQYQRKMRVDSTVATTK